MQETYGSVDSISACDPHGSASTHFEISRSLATPLLILDLDSIDRNVEQIRTAFPGISLYYAMKCNPHPAIIGRLKSLGVGFEIASQLELDLMQVIGVPSSQIACFHTIKSPSFLKSLERSGVELLAVDSLAELQKIAQFAPSSSVMIRLDTGTQNSRHLLNGKFGCSLSTGLELLTAARRTGLTLAGITMHVGSQCECLQDWALAARACSEFLSSASALGIDLELISLGGGLPVKYTTAIPCLSAINDCVMSVLDSQLSHGRTKLMIEPGRAIVASSGTLISTVVGLAERGEEYWVYLDTGVYHGLIEKLQISGGFVLPIQCEVPERPLRRYRLAGPTCDSMDVFPGTYELPELHVGDRISFGMAGAYSSAIATDFNGFPAPTTVLMADLTEKMLR